MPEYSFMNYLANSKDLYKFADDCLNDAVQKERQAVYNLLLYKVLKYGGFVSFNFTKHKLATSR